MRIGEEYSMSNMKYMTFDETLEEIRRYYRKNPDVSLLTSFCVRMTKIKRYRTGYAIKIIDRKLYESNV